MLLDILAGVIGYRFRSCLRPEFKLPINAPPSVRGEQGAKEIKEKARASSSVAGVFLGFSAVFLVAIISTPDLSPVLNPLYSPDYTLAFALLDVALPYLILREERRISAARVEAEEAALRATVGLTAEKATQWTENEVSRLRRKHYCHLAILSLALAGTLIPIFLHSFSGHLAPSLPVSGFFLIVLSLLLLIVSVEFYDTASGWQAGNDEIFHFHMASIASHCNLLGFALSAVGISLLLCLKHPRVGSIVTITVLVAVTAITEVERELVGLRKTERRPSLQGGETTATTAMERS